MIELTDEMYNAFRASVAEGNGYWKSLTAVLALVERDYLVEVRPPWEHPEPSPLTVRMRHIDIELTKLAGQPRTENVRKALDHWLDRRLQLRSGEGGAA